jgi:hypothetical protein
LSNKTCLALGRPPALKSILSTVEDMNLDSIINVLLYHIVFDIIGYRGPYTDYATRGFSIKEYPVATSPAARPEESTAS